MASTTQEYSMDAEIADFFKQTSAACSSCDLRAKELTGGNVTPVAIQGSCSYTVYAAPNDESVVQFRLKSLALKTDMDSIARTIYGTLVPSITYHGEIGDEHGEKESLSVYVMSRVPGISYLDFILAHDLPENSPEYCTWRENLIGDFARFFALAWKHPPDTPPSFRTTLHQRYEKDLRRLQSALPPRFTPIIQDSLTTLPAVTSLPLVLLHNDFGMSNIIVNAETNRLAGVIDWAEAEIGPFGTNLYVVQHLTGKFHLKDGWIRYANYDRLYRVFWDTFRAEVGGLSEETLGSIKAGMVVGLLLSHGFTSRLANMPEPEPIRDDERGAYQMLYLDGLLIVPGTRVVD